MSDASHKVTDLDVDLGQLFGSLLRNWLRILLVALAVAGLAYLLAGLVTPLYRAETRILIESRESIYTRPASAGISDSERVPVDDEMVTSQVELIGSADILRTVARQLDLAAHDEFGSAGETSTLGNLLVLFGLKNDPSQDSVEERVVKALQERLTIYRVDGSRVIVIRFSTTDKALASAIPNAIADAYVAQQEQAKRLSNADATDWLAPEIEDLRQRVRQAEARVAEYRAQSGLLPGLNDSVLPRQQLTEISSELTRISAERAAAEARARAISDAMASGMRIDAISDVLAAPLVQRLRERQAQIEADLADLSASLLGNHPRIRALRAQLNETERQMRVEVENVRLAAESEAASAKAREDQLAAEVNRLKAASAQAGDDEVELRALEREAAAERALLESYLTRYREAAARADGNSMPADVRIFERATTPHEPYFPKKGLIVIAVFAASLLMMSVAILLRELFSGRAMRPAAGAVLPVAAPIDVEAQPAKQSFDIPAGEREEAAIVDEMFAAPTEPMADETDPVESEDNMAAPRLQHDLQHGGVATSVVVERLIEGDAERAIFLSPQGDEATATSVMVARAIADAGLRVVFVDLTWSGAPSAVMLEGANLPGITNLLTAQARFADVIHGDAFSGCHVLPAGTGEREQAMRAIDRLPLILEALDTAYEIVVIECGAVDAQAITSVTTDRAELIIAALDPDNPVVTALVDDLAAAGFDETMVALSEIHEQAELHDDYDNYKEAAM